LTGSFARRGRLILGFGRGGIGRVGFRGA
jgi:hypothetical protein